MAALERKDCDRIAALLRGWGWRVEDKNGGRGAATRRIAYPPQGGPVIVFSPSKGRAADQTYAQFRRAGVELDPRRIGNHHEGRAAAGEAAEPKPTPEVPAQRAVEAVKPVSPAPKPLLEETQMDELARQWRFSPHAAQRCEERGISPAEVMAAIVQPDSEWEKADDSGRRIHRRGDVEVVTEPAERVVVTVIDRAAQVREEPRQPIVPSPLRVAAVVAERAEVRAEPEPADESESTAGVDRVRAYVRTLALPFRTREVNEAFAGDLGVSSSTVSNVLREMVAAGELDRPEVGQYVPATGDQRLARAESDAVPKPQVRAPEPAPAAPAATGVTAVFEWEEPESARLSKARQEEQALADALRAAVDQLRAHPGKTACVLVFAEGTAKHIAADRVRKVKDQFPGFVLKSALRPDKKAIGVYARWEEDTIA